MRHTQPVVLDGTPWLVMPARHITADYASKEEDELVRLQEHFGIEFESLAEAYGSAEFEREASRGRRVLRVFGMLPYIWLQMLDRTLQEVAYCVACGWPFERIGTRQRYCRLPECRKQRQNDRAQRSRTLRRSVS